ncbi:hypothetical protein PFDSM3638_08155 [Pyrococcus furiosus DSM 3638]|uniref:Uncharacterized protein n=3 Tax=Pyrococcus furiosus TaxID=2261 RepID=A0A5C0XQW5_PYRFU|nr:hypothetical protein PF1614 [Pyrococcus furiosus DSM 3638]AFN05026.1 hypothetical protein PFC_10535 [Pyrococcus furiosus COM1]QEK79237.1 hypothetical protein PFDSM3638_08155 [Pyrococcus furiosus DSM 3638]
MTFPLLYIPSLTPEKRVKIFLSEIREDYVSLRGFIILRKPPCDVPFKYIEYLLSPLAPSEISKSKIKAYAVVRITEKTEIKGRLHSGGYVKVEGRVEPYPCGNMRVITADSIVTEDFSKYWALKEYSLSPKEIRKIIGSALYASAELQDSFLYSLFGAPYIMKNPLNWREGYNLFVMKNNERIVKSLFEFFKGFTELLPRELRVERDDKWMFADEFLDLDFKVFNPNNTDIRYYAPKNIRNVLPKWLKGKFERKEFIYFIPRKSKPDIRDYYAKYSETPFILYEPIEFEFSELREYLPNILATVFWRRTTLPALNPLSEEIRVFRELFEHWLWKNRYEYGEIIDALLVKDSLFNLNRRYLLSLNVLGSIARLIGKIEKSYMNLVLNIEQEILDTWINEVPKAEIDAFLAEYKKNYLGDDRVLPKALQVILDLSSTSVDGLISKEEIMETLLRLGFTKAKAEESIEKLVANGYIYEPVSGFYKVVKSG